MACHHMTLHQVFRLPIHAGMALLEARATRLALEAGHPAPSGGFTDRFIAAARSKRERELRASYTIIPNAKPANLEPGT